jgi:hypothetical protein
MEILEKLYKVIS